MFLTDLLMLALVAVYSFLLYIVYKNRNHIGVQSRSPKLILIGGIGTLIHSIMIDIALLSDSVINILIAITTSDGC